MHRCGDGSGALRCHASNTYGNAVGVNAAPRGAVPRRSAPTGSDVNEPFLWRSYFRPFKVGRPSKQSGIISLYPPWEWSETGGYTVSLLCVCVWVSVRTHSSEVPARPAKRPQNISTRRRSECITFWSLLCYIKAVNKFTRCIYALSERFLVFFVWHWTDLYVFRVHMTSSTGFYPIGCRKTGNCRRLNSHCRRDETRRFTGIVVGRWCEWDITKGARMTTCGDFMAPLISWPYFSVLCLPVCLVCYNGR